jgi:hypothetical protein
LKDKLDRELTELNPESRDYENKKAGLARRKNRVVLEDCQRRAKTRSI